MSSSLKPFVIDNCLSVKTASEYSGYSQQYIRRLLRLEKLAGLKLGQQWLVEMESFSSYLDKVEKSHDNRFGSKKLTQNGYI
jgi:excisionase family DNA binding protein